MSWGFDPSTWTTATKPSVANFQSIATDLHTLGANKDGAGYGHANGSFVTLVPGAKPGTTYTVTGGSWATGTATLTIGTHAIKVGQHVTVTSVTPIGYNNADVVVTGITSTTFAFALAANPGAYTSGGSTLVGTTPAEGMLAIDENGVLKEYISSAWTTVGTGGSRPYSVAYASGAQSVPNVTLTALSFDTNTVDVGGVHSTSVNPTRFTVPTAGAGVYVVSGGVYTTSAGGTIRQIRAVKNGSVIVAVQSVAAFANCIVSVAALASLADADYIEFFAYQDTGGSINTTGGIGLTTGSVARII